MEVHHHAHIADPDSHRGRKKWTHYFWEFLMLFLAVFAGFLAENQREHMVENKREKTFMKSLLEDLHIDTAEVNDELRLARSQINITDTQMTIINYHDLDSENINKLYLLNYSMWLVGPYFEDRTSAQLKNAGAMRLIHSKQVTDAISVYWKSIKFCETMTQLYETYAHNISETGIKIFNNKYVVDTVRGEPPTEIKPGAKFIRNDPELFAEYSNRLKVKRNLLSFFIRRMELTTQYAVSLMEIIRKEYHFKN